MGEPSCLEWRANSAHVCAMPGLIATARIESPIGRLTLTAEGDYLSGIRIARADTPGTTDRISGDTRHPVLAEAIAQLQRWFAADLQEFSLPLAPPGSAEGEALRAGIASIPYGETLTYGALGDRIGSVARAVGQACKTNPYPLIIPCHRVTSATGPEYYSGGDGPRTKSWLLDFEYAHLPAERRTRLL
jgi:methylated-DNA-[protein]-cysteine S-methyltransferase